MVALTRRTPGSGASEYSNAIHLLYPLHLVSSFEVFGYTFFFGVFFYEPRKEILRLLLDICEVGMELAGSD